jgi:hypothetical protein
MSLMAKGRGDALAQELSFEETAYNGNKSLFIFVLRAFLGC